MKDIIYISIDIILLLILFLYFYFNRNLKKQKNKIETLFNKTPIGYVIGDLKERKILSANNYAYQLFEYPLEKPLNISTEEFHINKEKFNEFLNITNNYIKENGSLEGFKIIWKFKTFSTNKILNINLMATMYSDKEVLWILNDISNIINIKEQLENELNKNKKLLKVKEDFLSNISHELKTPLNSILGFTNVLLEEEINNKKLKYLKLIYKSSNNLYQIINDILNINKINKQDIKIYKTTFNLINFIDNIKKTYENDLKDKNINLYIDYKLENNELIYTDKILLKEIIGHLIDNAIKYSNNKSNIFIKYYTFKKRLYFEILNKGEKLTQEKFKYFINKYKNNDLNNKNNNKLSIGLTIVNNFLNILNSKLKLLSKENYNKFYFSIPIDYIDINNIENILIVEDNKANQLFLKVLLNNLGYKKISIVENGKECIRFLKQNKIDLIFMDINMPVMNGLITTKILKRKCKINIPIVAITANKLSEEDIKNFDSFITKPVSKEDLQKILKNKFF